MTPQEFQAKFPDRTRINDNCMENVACPKCGERDKVFIVATTEVEVIDEGTDSRGDVEWDEQSPCRCGGCGYRGVVQEFTVEGLDDFLREEAEDGGCTCANYSWYGEGHCSACPCSR